MSGFHREYDSDGYVLDGSYYGDGDIDTPLQGIAKARAQFVNECWCGNRKHAGWPLCSVCQVVLEKDAAR